MTSLLQKLSDDCPGKKDDAELVNYNVISITHLFSEIMMLLSSRARLFYIENLKDINTSVVNYGIDEYFDDNVNRNQQAIILQKRIKTTFERFEPRLSNVIIDFKLQPLSITNFCVSAVFHKQNIDFILIWDEAIRQFSLITDEID